MQYPADGAGVLAPLCCKVQGPPVMWACSGRLSAFHTSADCAKSEGTGKSRMAARESTSVKETENDRCFTAKLLVMRHLPRSTSSPEDVRFLYVHEPQTDVKLFSLIKTQSALPTGP